MKENIVIKFGIKGPHKIHKQWLDSITTETVPFTPINLHKIHPSLSPLNQVLSILGSPFLPKAKRYYLSSIGAVPATIFNKYWYKSKVYTINSDTFIYDLEKASFLKKKYMLWLLKHLNGVICTSEVVQKKLEKYVAVPSTVVYPFCNVEKFSDIQPDYEGSNLCSVSTPKKIKGGDLFPEIHNIFRKNFSDSKLYILGEGDLVNQLKTKEGIICTGHADPTEYFSKSGIYINPARIEAFGVNIIEAMCAGLPSLVTEQCGASDIVARADPWLVSAVDAKEIAEKAIQLHSNIKKKRRLGQKCRKIAEKLTKEESTKEFQNKLKLFEC